MNLQENIRRILKEVRVPRSERVELYKDENIIVVVPLTHRALQKYAHQCQWCINDDKGEWEDYHKGKHAVIIQRNPKKPKIGITGNPTASEIFLLAKWDNNQSSFEDVCQMLDYEFRNDRTMSDYYVTISNDINNFATNIVYYSPETGIYDQENNFLWNFNIEINDIPNVKPKVIEIMDDYLRENEEMSLQESIRRILREELSPRIRRRVPADEMEREFLESFEIAYNITKNRKVLSKHFLNELIYTTASVMMSGIHWRLFTTLPEDEFWYDEIHNELENHYRDRIIKMYKEREGINESILKEESKRDEMIDLYLAKRVSSFTKFDMKDGLHPRIEFVDDKSHHSMVVIHFNRRAQKNEVNMDDSLYGEIYNMFSMDGFEEIQKHLKRWFSNNFDGLNDISEIYTFENDEYIY